MKISIGMANTNDIPCILKLCKDFERESCCNGIVAATKEELQNKDVFMIKADEKLVGYCYGYVEIKNRDTSFYKTGQNVFYLEEIFIAPDFRSKNLGSKLFKFVEKHAENIGCDFLETTAVSKDYKKLLKFYIDDLNMQFWHASLIKKI